MASTAKHRKKKKLKRLDTLIRGLENERKHEAKNPYECGLSDPKTCGRVDLADSVALLWELRGLIE